MVVPHEEVAVAQTRVSRNKQVRTVLHQAMNARWLQTVELEYEAGGNTAAPKSVCFHCGKDPADSSELLKCGKCRVAAYCSKDCQLKDWKGGGHKHACDSYKRVGPNISLTDDQDRTDARQELVQRVSLYAFPYAVHKTETLGKGFLFIQSTHSLAIMSLKKHQDSWGRTVRGRAVLLHYLTIGEFDAEVSRDDFELVHIRQKLLEAIEQYSIDEEIVTLMRFRCGHVAVGIVKLVPEYNQCKEMGALQFSTVAAGSVELQLDDLN